MNKFYKGLLQPAIYNHGGRCLQLVDNLFSIQVSITFSYRPLEHANVDCLANQTFGSGLQRQVATRNVLSKHLPIKYLSFATSRYLFLPASQIITPSERVWSNMNRLPKISSQREANA